MIHGHVYVDKAPSTKHIIPCGALEEFKDICDVVRDRNLRQFAVNLKGHGFVIASEDIAGLKDIKYIPRYRMGKPQKILSSGTARCKLDHYNHDVDVDSTYKFESREVFNGNKFIRVYYHEKSWGVPDYHNYPVCEFNKYFECIEGKI